MYEVDRGIAFGQYEYIEVEFPSADVDVRIRHQMKVSPFTEVYYIPVKMDRAAIVYNGTLSLWSPQYIALKSNTAGLTATLLLFTRS